ncbi:MAG: hypothetical protein JSU72_11010, partial [Deltaproteobacteria bacterium]
VAGPTNGTLSGTLPNLTYTPNGDFNGGDSFTFKASDGIAASAVATVSINVETVDPSPVSPYTLLVSLSSTRSAPVPLEGALLSGDIFVFSSPDTDVDRVKFFLDDPTMSESAVQKERSAPYDFAGGTAASANPFDTTEVQDGLHTITALIELHGGDSMVVHATFTVGIPDGS